MRTRLSLALLAAAASTARQARGDDLVAATLNTWLAPGVVSSWAASRESARGFGFELSGGYYAKAPLWAPIPPIPPGPPLAIGGVLRAQGYDGDGAYARRTGAGELAWGPVGLELGLWC